MTEAMSSSVGKSQDRMRAARILVGVLHQGKTTDQSFGSREPTPLLQELVYGTLRHYYTLDALVGAELERSLRSKDLDLRCLMLVGAYQLHYTRIPDHAAINETVTACRGLKKPWARGLVNAVLRKVAKEGPTERSFGLPDWIVEKIDLAYPDDAEAVMAATLERAPMSLRINTSRVDPGDYLAQLQEAGIRANPGWLPENLILESPVSARKLPGFADGQVSVQDGGAQFAAPLVSGTAVPGARGIERPAPGRILDACAAPGGKLFHITERAPDALVFGLELSEPRMTHLQEEAARLGHPDVQLILGDAAKSDWCTDPSYDAILLDAPCSGSGTLRRHPDIKILRKASDLAVYAALQFDLLTNLWQMLADGGTLVYCTCSLFAEENDQVVERFLATESQAHIVDFTLPVGRKTKHGWQLVPLPQNTPEKASGPDKSVDGFYFARMTRREEAR